MSLGDEQRLTRGTLLAGRFELHDQAGAGGMGSVYRATDRLTGQDVAVKILAARSPDHDARFEREATLLSRVNHPGVVRYVAHGGEAGLLFLVMEWVRGQTLEKRLETELSYDEAIRFAFRVAEPIAEVHRLGLLHRDLKPENIILEGGEIERVKVIDFGVARSTEYEAVSLTRTGALIGTPAYMSPEQIRSRRDIDARTDVFALGCLLFRCLTGQNAFQGLNLMAIRFKLLFDETPRIRAIRPDLPEALDAFLARALAREREERPADAREFAVELRRALDSTGAQPAPQPAPRETPRAALFVVAANPLADDPEPALATTLSAEHLADSQREIERITAEYHGRVEFLADGSFLALFTGDQSADVVERAITCARALRAALPDWPLVVAAQPPATPRGPALDRGVQTLVAESMTRLFGPVSAPGVPPGAIRLEDSAAQLLSAAQVLQAAGGYYLAAG